MLPKVRVVFNTKMSYKNYHINVGEPQGSFRFKRRKMTEKRSSKNLNSLWVKWCTSSMNKCVYVSLTILQYTFNLPLNSDFWKHFHSHDIIILGDFGLFVARCKLVYLFIKKYEYYIYFPIVCAVISYFLRNRKRSTYWTWHHSVYIKIMNNHYGKYFTNASRDMFITNIFQFLVIL